MTIEIDSTRHHHAVQFYEDEQFLVGRVAEFLAEGAREGEPCVVIATAEHNASFAAALRSSGVDTEAIRFLDARATLEQFLDRGMPDAGRFREVIGGALQEVRGPLSRVRAYGEMVDLLWRDGEPDAAIRLEELWNDLAGHSTFSLLCAYPMANFYKESDGHLFERVCAAHGIVRPTGSTEADDPLVRDRKIAALEQRAAALELEIAQRKLLEGRLSEALAARRRSEELLRDFVDNATIGLHWVRADGTIEWANDAELKLLGYTREEYVGRNITEFHADPERIGDILCRLGRNEEIHDYEAPLRAKDGSVKWVAINSNALFENGELVHTRCFSRDITARRRLEEQNDLLLEATGVLARSLDYQTRLGDLSRVIVPRIADWCVIEVATDEGSERVAVAHADPALEPLGERWSAQSGRDAVRRVLETGEPVMGEEPLPELRGLGLHSFMIVPMLAFGRVVGAIALVGADTRRPYTSDDLPLALDLASRAAGMIEIARLYHVAQASNRAKDQFLATLSHELRTPLTAILGWAKMMAMGGLDEETLRIAVATIEQSARTQAALVEDLLDVSRVVSGKLSLQSEPVDLGDLVSDVVRTMRMAADAKGIHVESSAPDERLIVRGDATRLQQIVWNLVSNAIKFSHDGARVGVKLEHRGHHARVIVRDDGHGIAPAFLPFVFDPFRQADPTSTRSHGGLGLGLAIVKYLAEAHGGTVSAESAGLGQGCTFTVTLPLARRSRGAGETTDELPDLTGARILVVDDDASSRRMLQAALGRCGAEVETADSVRSARAAIERRPPDLVVTDIAMPHEDGLALLRHVRAGERTRGIPVVALTAFHHRADLRKEFDAFLEKPMDPMEIARRIARARTAH
jgi:PAS domain S-box-containing protein